MEDLKKRLKQIIVEKSYRRGEFTLTSGKKSDFYIDGKQTTLHPEGAWLCGKLILEEIRKSGDNIGAVGGMTLGADPLVTATGVVSHIEGTPLPAFIIRKNAKGHGTGQYLEGLKNIAPGTRVALIEDVVTTGGTLITAIERTEAAGLTVAMIITVVDRREGGSENLNRAGYPLRSIFTREEIMS